MVGRDTSTWAKAINMQATPSRATANGERCRFLTKNDRAALSVAFCNYLSLGQFELARAVFLRLHKDEALQL